jgi:hypothetical protein
MSRSWSSVVSVRGRTPRSSVPPALLTHMSSPAELFQRSFGEPIGDPVAEIAGELDSPPAAGAHFGSDRADFWCSAGGHYHVCTGVGQRECN